MESSSLTMAFGLLLLLFRWWLVGYCWLWTGFCGVRPRAWILVVVPILQGLVVTSLIALVLLALGLWSHRMEWAATGFLALTGWMIGKWRGHAWSAPSGSTLVGFGFLALAWLVMAGLPNRGEWIVGGWDPGIYIQHGVVLAHEGSWRPQPDPFWSMLADDELGMFTRQNFNYIEAYPVVPLDPERRTLEPFFFPLTPVVMAQIFRAGGLMAVCRTNEWLGLLAVLMVALAAYRMTRSRLIALSTIVLFSTHQIWLYHAHFPTSEVLHVLLLGGIAWGIAPSRRTNSGITWTALIFLAAGLNRLAFLPFGALLIASDALFRPAARGRGWWAAAMLLAGAGDAIAVPITIGRLGNSVTSLVGFAILILTGAFFVALAAKWPNVRRWLRRVQLFGTPGAIMVAVLMFTALWLVGGRLPEILKTAAWNARLMWFYGQPIPLLLAMGGVFLTCWGRIGFGQAWRSWLLFLVAAATLTSLAPEISRIAPWAVRRQVEFFMPLLALGGAGLIYFSCKRVSGKWGIPLGVAIGAVILLVQSPRGMKAWSATEYNGLHGMMTRVADQLTDRDVVVADHFKWATPLRRIYGKNVLTGEVWSSPSRERDFQPARNRLRELAEARGGRLLFLTTTDEQKKVFPVKDGELVEIWSSGPWRYNEVIQSSRSRSMELKERKKTFRLFIEN